MANIYDLKDFGALLKENSYAGRGIAVGKSENGEFAVTAYFIMGRSANSRNRVFVKKENDEVIIYPFDESKVEDPSLIIYSPIKKINNSLIVTNGDQTDTIYDFIKDNKSFEDALETREFEPDAPNFTPRISAIMNFSDSNFSYKMSILKSEDEKGSECARYTYSYKSINGMGSFIHTYNHDGNPLPTFTGEPHRIKIPDSIDEFTTTIWNSLNEENKISLCVKYINLKTMKSQTRIINKNK